MSSKTDTVNCLVLLLSQQIGPDAEVDMEKLAEALNLSSLQQLVFLKSVNTEFGVNLTPEDLEDARGKGGLISLLDKA